MVVVPIRQLDLLVFWTKQNSESQSSNVDNLSKPLKDCLSTSVKRCANKFRVFPSSKIQCRLDVGSIEHRVNLASFQHDSGNR